MAQLLLWKPVTQAVRDEVNSKSSTDKALLMDLNPLHPESSPTNCLAMLGMYALFGRSWKAEIVKILRPSFVRIGH